MKNRMPTMNQPKLPDWLYEETEDDDFLTGKSPKDLSDVWEEEE